MQAYAQGSNMQVDPKAPELLVNKDTAEQVLYGSEGLPDDLKRQAPEGEKTEDLVTDPEVLSKVIESVEEQRDQLFTFSQNELSGSKNVPLIEEMRLKNNELVTAQKNLTLELKKAQAIASANAVSASSGPSQSAYDEMQKKVTKLQAEVAGRDASAGNSVKQVQELEARLKEKEEALVQAMAAAGGGGDAGAQMAAMMQKLTEAERDLAHSKMATMQAEAQLVQAQAAAGPDPGAMRALETKLAAEQANSAALQRQIDNTPKSSACAIQ